MFEKLIKTVIFAFTILYLSPQVGMMLSFLSVIFLILLPAVALITFIVPSLRLRFLSA